MLTVSLSKSKSIGVNASNSPSLIPHQYSISKATYDNGSSLKLSALAISTANYGLKWQASNDGYNYTDLSVSSITYSTAGSTLWDFDDYNYKYLRAVFTAGTSGAVKMILRYFGKY